MSRHPPTTLVIEPRRGWRFIDWRELTESRDLFRFLVSRDVKAQYKQSILGFGWAIIQPVVNMVLFTVVFGRLAGVSTDDVPGPLFYFAALVPWTYFNNALTGAANSLVAQSNLLSKVYVPRLVIPLTPILAKLIDFTIALSILFMMIVGYHAFSPGFTFQNPSRLLVLPVLIVLMVLTASGLGMLLSALAVRYRDIKFAIPFLIQLLMYAAPVVWPVSLVSPQFRVWLGLYPMFGVIEGFRSALISTHPVPWDLIASGTAGALTIAIVGALVFRRQERWFADVV